MPEYGEDFSTFKHADTLSEIFIRKANKFTLCYEFVYIIQTSLTFANPYHKLIIIAFNRPPSKATQMTTRSFSCTQVLLYVEYLCNTVLTVKKRF